MHRIERSGRIRFITFSCHRRLPLLTDPTICRIATDAMASMTSRYSVRIHAWVFMPEHVHLLATPTTDGLTIALRAMKTSIAKRAINRWKELDASILHRILASDGRPRFWQKGGGFDRNVRDLAELRKEIRYIHHNPVERGLVDQPEHWKWSSVHWWMGARDGEFPCEYPPGDPQSWAGWRGFV